MNRWDIINHYIKKLNATSYLEIGYYKGWNFDRIECEFKKAVDPFPCKTLEQEQLEYGSTIFYEQGDSKHTSVICSISKLKSDEYFHTLKDLKYDVIFIDGLHESKQVHNDILNSLNHLKQRGVIIIHDCNPPKYEHTTTGIDGCWTGDVYKAILNIRSRPFLPYNVNFKCVDTDWGVGILTISNKIEPVIPYTDDWSQFDQNRKPYLNLISVEEFKNQENIQ